MSETHRQRVTKITENLIVETIYIRRTLFMPFMFQLLFIGDFIMKTTMILMAQINEFLYKLSRFYSIQFQISDSTVTHHFIFNPTIR